MSKKLGKAAFVITKPLQLMVALCIAQQEVFELKPVFIIVDAFSGAKEVADRLACNFIDLQVSEYFSTHKLAYKYLYENKIKNIFIDSDVGLRKYITLAKLNIGNSGIQIHVYEEGLGTYRTDMYSGLKEKLLNLIGVGTVFGGCCFVRNIYVFNKKEYICNMPRYRFKAKLIRGGLAKFIEINRKDLNKIFNFSEIDPESVNNPMCSIYLSDWRIDDNFMLYFKRLEGDLFLKPHPHIKSKIVKNEVQLFDARIPAELILINLVENFQSVQVYDHNSSVRRYINNKKIKYNLVDDA